ncbi:hypothetical protein BASA50_002759 [Batrachochytrium salamandrivorans]|uniref:RNA polymerase II subunit A C-terminal domain phosphatase n=1 Tax=Batrachochytrium salamandrivorans TaxID=1357716 RepID=A0ABQ8FKP7_9FUNG|nr:hypothetical protein BASA62_001553 [Batrachochytrium salamandrivorans]KAH6597434.1 hypothetical protein BASA61_003149 [Batrachochytrium salamandrivorans]KAH6599828.1 hypothetical protein BASA50_002759 [Batrachochytrium salamandrivorans]KAH9267428.1 hypothetical protein BASA83_009967 [Batrachochytrium salamandrivorans]
METPQSVLLPKSCFPIVLVSWKVCINDMVLKDQPLGTYEFMETVVNEPTPSTDDYSSALPLSYKKRTRREIRSIYEGRVDLLGAQPGDTVHDPRHVMLVIVEPCGHPVQLNGLCAVCGKDLSIADYTGTDMERATIRMTHDASGITVSHREAFRLEKETADRLLDDRKLSLVLDLDQTVIHATVDPTVGEWMADPDNPNFPALTEVHSFVLPDSPVLYYIKLRPGTREFLIDLYEKYEMHIYTMGTRNYARAVAKILDPDKRFFKDRILSRDDSGSFSVKSLQRLFPCDQSMVVVVDDRADVWHWSPNLLCIKAYDFFVGIGDINEPVYAAAAEMHEVGKSRSSSQPPSLAGPAAPKQTVASASSSSITSIVPPIGGSDSSAALKQNAIPFGATDIPELEDSKLPSDSDSDSETSENKAEMLAKMQDVQLHALEDQQKNRPLLHCQEEMDSRPADLPSKTVDSNTDSPKDEPTEATTVPTPPVLNDEQSLPSLEVLPKVSFAIADTPLPLDRAPGIAKKRPVLIDTDHELSLIKLLMMYIHSTFYERSDIGDIQNSDVRVIVPEMKRKILSGVHILFTSIIPLGLDPHRHEHWISATSYGAVCHIDLDAEVTHVIAGKTGTAKVNAARKRPNLAIVKLDWLLDCIRTWRRPDEIPYLLYPDEIPVGLPSLPSASLFVCPDSSHQPGGSSVRVGVDLEEGDLLGGPQDLDELLIVQGKWERENEIYEKVGGDDWKEMDAEVEMAMLEDDSSDVTADDASSGLDEEDIQKRNDEGHPSFDLKNGSLGHGTDLPTDTLGHGRAIDTTTTTRSEADDDDWDSLADEIEIGLEEALASRQSSKTSRSTPSTPVPSHSTTITATTTSLPSYSRRELAYPARAPSPLSQSQVIESNDHTTLSDVQVMGVSETDDEAYFHQMEAWDNDATDPHRIPKRKFQEVQDDLGDGENEGNKSDDDGDGDGVENENDNDHAVDMEDLGENSFY